MATAGLWYLLLILQEGLKVRRLCRRTYFVIERVCGQVGKDVIEDFYWNGEGLPYLEVY